MTTIQGPKKKTVDELLKRVLTDDLPAEVETGLRERIVRFRAGTTRSEERAAVAAWTWLFRRPALAILSTLMLVAGILLQGLGSRSSLAESIARIKTAVSSSETHRRPGRAGVAGNFLVTAPEGRPISNSQDKEATS